MYARANSNWKHKWIRWKKKKNAITKSKKSEEKNHAHTDHDARFPFYHSHFVLLISFFGIFTLVSSSSGRSFFCFDFFFARHFYSVWLCLCALCARTTFLWLFAWRYVPCALSHTHTHSVNELSFTFSAYFLLLLSIRNRNGLGICLNLCTDTIMNVYLHFMRYKIFHSSKERLSLLIFVCISSESPFKNECLPTSIYPWLCTQRHLTSGLEWIYWIVRILSDYFCHVALFDSILLVCLFLSSIPFRNQHRNILSQNWRILHKYLHSCPMSNFYANHGLNVIDYI